MRLDVSLTRLSLQVVDTFTMTMTHTPHTPTLDRRAQTPWARLERLGWRHGSKAIDAGMAGDTDTYTRQMAISTAFYAASRQTQVTR